MILKVKFVTEEKTWVSGAINNSIDNKLESLKSNFLNVNKNYTIECPILK